jgi:protein pelota
LRITKISPLKRLVTAVPETTLDLLNLFMVLEVDDMVYAEVSREMKKERRDGSVDSERVRLEIGLQLERKSLNPMMKRLELLGIIRYESRKLGLLGKHHSIHVNVGTEITVESRKNYVRLESMARYYRQQPENKIAVVLLDDEGVSALLLGPHSAETLYNKRVSATGKEDPDERFKTLNNLYSSAAAALGEKLDTKTEILLFGPAVYLEDFRKHLREHAGDLLDCVKKSGYVSDSTAAGLSEILRSGMLSEYGERLKMVTDSKALEELLARLASSPDKVAIGFDEAVAALEMAAVEKLLVGEDFLWERLHEEGVAGMLEKAGATGASVQVIASGSEPSDTLSSLGGVVALLRYPVDPSLLKNPNRPSPSK